jgi:hypothetical protein
MEVMKQYRSYGLVENFKVREPLGSRALLRVSPAELQLAEEQALSTLFGVTIDLSSVDGIVATGLDTEGKLPGQGNPSVVNICAYLKAIKPFKIRQCLVFKG